MEIIADVDDAAREVILTIHWRGGQHSQLRVRKRKSGEHTLFKLLSLRDHKPDVWRRASKFLCLEDLLHHRLRAT